MKIYKTNEIARLVKVHPNTIRFYEDMGFISKPKRLENNYRQYTDIQLFQCYILRHLFKNEIMQKGIRKKVLLIVKLCASNEYNKVVNELNIYMGMLEKEKQCALEAINTVENILNNSITNMHEYKRLDAAIILNTTVDTIRNWELNGLITVKRRSNGYRVYNDYDIEILKIIKVLRESDYSLSSILRLLNNLYKYKNVNVRKVLNESDCKDEIITACDHLIDSINSALSEINIVKGYVDKLIKF